MSKKPQESMPKISDAEWQVMQVLWEESPLSAAQVVERIANEQDWSPRTVKTMLGRLLQKEALTFTQEGNRYLYRPAVSRSACLRDASKSFLSRVFSGDTRLLLAHLVDAGKLSNDDIQTLKQILQDKESE